MKRLILLLLLAGCTTEEYRQNYERDSWDYCHKRLKFAGTKADTLRVITTRPNTECANYTGARP